MYILGINAIYHESAACLIKDGRIVAAAEEERFNRIKHGKPAFGDNADELPVHAIRFCLESAGIAMEQVAHIGYSASLQLCRAWLQQQQRSQSDSEPAKPLYWSRAVEALERVGEKLAALGFRGQLQWVEHHVAHAASAYYVSPFSDAAVLAVDGVGEKDTAVLCHGQGNQLRQIASVPRPASLGFLWEVLSLFLGFDVYDAAKVMGLAAYGDPQRFAAAFDRLGEQLADGTFTLDRSITRFKSLRYDPPSADFGGFIDLLGIEPRAQHEPLKQEHQDLAATLQQYTNRLMMHMTQHLHAQTGSENLCLAGGVALNCVANSFLFEEGPFKNLFVQPAANDAGTAMGAAYYIWNHLLQQSQRETMHHAYLGPGFSDAEIEARLRAHGLRYRRSDAIEEEVAALISRGNIVGFMQGRMELGPRALGNRSLLADPRHPGMREILNAKVKHREYFRPLAPSVLHEEVDKWFTIKKQTPATDFMLMTYPVRPEVRERIPAVVHVDGSSRIQTVRRESNPRYHRLISAFQALTGVPILLNTSFNDSEPIVCTPDDAINTFQKTQIDYLAAGSYLVSKAENPSAG